MWIKTLFQTILTFQAILVSSVSFKKLPGETYPVNVLAFVFPPFTYFDSSHGFVDGIDVHLLNAMARKLNLKLIWTKANKMHVISKEKFKKFDVIIGGIRSDILSNFTDFVASAPYMQDDLTWCVSHAKAIPQWKNIYYIVKDVTTFTWGGIMYIITIFGPFFFTMFEEKPLDFGYCAILSAQTLIGFASTFNPKRSILRFHFVLSLVVSFWLTQFFCAFLMIYTLRILYENQISTLDEIAENDFHLAGDSYIFDHLNAKKLFSKEQLSNFEVCNEIDKCLHRLEYDDKLAVATSRYHIRAMPLQKHIFCFDQSQNIENYLNTLMIRNDFRMKREFDSMLKKFITAGLLTKWQKNLRLYRVSVELISEDESLSLNHFSYAFITLIPITSLSIFTFFVELIISNKANSVNASKYWRFWDKFISGKRYFLLLEPRNDDLILPFTK